MFAVASAKEELELCSSLCRPAAWLCSAQVVGQLEEGVSVISVVWDRDSGEEHQSITSRQQHLDLLSSLAWT